MHAAQAEEYHGLKNKCLQSALQWLTVQTCNAFFKVGCEERQWLTLQTCNVFSRLAVRMQHANMEHAETACREDIEAMKNWLDRAQAHANRQVPQLHDPLSNIKIFN